MVIRFATRGGWHLPTKFGKLVLDERESSYPDAAVAADGTIRAIYVHQRYTENREGKTGVGSVMMAVFREADVRAGSLVGDGSRLRRVVSQLRPDTM